MKLFVLCLLFSFCSVFGAQSDAKHPLVIVDGDSVNIDILLFLDFAQVHQGSMDDRALLRMRIDGIDTPEWDQPCEKNLGMVINCGELATTHLQNLLDSFSGELVLKPMGVDYYNRVLIRLFIGETDVGKQMVLDGMAYSYDKTYLIEESLARSEKRGFWAFAKPPINPKEWRKNKN